MRRIVTPVLLLAVALAALFGANSLSDQLHENLGEVADTDAAPPGVGTPLVSTRRLAEMLAPSLAEPEFFTGLDALMATAPVSSCLTVMLDDRVFYESGGGIQVMPSEAMLLPTLATAHKVLGPDHTFTTTVQSVVPVENGVVNGDIYLVGGGDPLLYTPAYAAARDEGDNPLHTPIEDLAQDLVDQGLALVTGAVVGDADRFDDLRYAGSWPERIIASQNIGTLLALQFDDGWVQFPTQEPNEEGDTDAEGEPEGFVAAEDPPFYAAALFDDMLEARDVVIRRSPRAEAFPDGEEPNVLATIESAPPVRPLPPDPRQPGHRDHRDAAQGGGAGDFGHGQHSGGHPGHRRRSGRYRRGHRPIPAPAVRRLRGGPGQHRHLPGVHLVAAQLGVSPLVPRSAAHSRRGCRAAGPLRRRGPPVPYPGAHRWNRRHHGDHGLRGHRAGSGADLRLHRQSARGRRQSGHPATRDPYRSSPGYPHRPAQPGRHRPRTLSASADPHSMEPEASTMAMFPDGFGT